jgi:hypothetical protein
MSILSSLKDFISTSERETRISALKAKKTISVLETKELRVLKYAELHNMEHAYGALLSKAMVLDCLFANASSNFSENEQSQKWDYLAVNMGYDDKLKSKKMTDKIKPILTFFKGTLGNLSIVDYESILPTGGGGDGKNPVTIPPPTITP